MLSMLTLISSSGMLEFGENNNILLILVKYMFITGGIVYLLFSYLVVRQISLMSKTLDTVASTTNKTLGFTHFVLSILVLIYFVLVL